MNTYLDYFKEICAIPHGSGNTKAISDYLVKFAKDKGLEYHQDSFNNVIIIKEAAKGLDKKPAVIIQGHMDMVAVKEPDATIDMEKEGLRLLSDGDFLYAEGTSLGGDDGVAVAYGLAILDDDSLKLPRIELVVTVDEEIGMLGADAIDLSPCKGQLLLNIDSEDEGIFLVSCAGGARIDLKYPCETLENPSGDVYKISISGLIGGHSGTEIDKGRANAIVLMSKILKKLSDAKKISGIEYISGGTADNAICNACEAVILSDEIEPELFEIIKYEVLEKYLSTEKNALIELKKLNESAGDLTWLKDSEGGLEKFLTSLPNGVIAMSRDIEGLVETSLNQGIISTNETGVSLSLSVRSNVDDKKAELIRQILDIATTHHTISCVRGDYPGWAYRKDSYLREKMIEVYRNMYGCDPKVEALHAGLECGIFNKKIANLDAVSFGPNILDIHTTKERLSLSSLERVYDYLVKVLNAI